MYFFFPLMLWVVMVIESTPKTTTIDSSSQLSLKQLYNEMIKMMNDNNCKIQLCSKNAVLVSSVLCKYIPMNLNKNWAIDNLTIKSTEIQVLKENSFNKLTNLKILQINNNPLKSLKEGCFNRLINVQNLSLAYNKLSIIHPKSFIGLENLRILKLEGNRLNSISMLTNALSPNVLPKLKTLHLDRNFFRTITSEDFAPMSGSSVENLDLKKCEILEFDSGALQHLPNLQSLKLWGNIDFKNESIVNLIKALKNTNVTSVDISKLMYHSIPTDILRLIPNDSSITSLGINKYETAILKKGVIPYLPSLTSLNLNHLKMVKIEMGAFDNVPNLQHLTLINNYLFEIPVAIGTLHHLKSLNIAGKGKFTNYMTVHNYNFTNNSKIKFLDFSRNRIGNITKNCFAGANSLETLTLISCTIYMISFDAFHDNLNLKVLNLAKNPIIQVGLVDGGIFPALKKLDTLHLSDMDLTKLLENVGQSPFRHLKHLRHLDLENSKLTKISIKIFHGLDDLRTLNLKSNLLHDWDDYTFSSIKNASLIDLSSNNISGDGVFFIKDLKLVAAANEETVIDLSFNPFSCSCKSFMFHKWLKSTNIKLNAYDSYETYKNYQCSKINVPLVDHIASPCELESSKYAIIGTLSICAFFAILMIAFYMILRFKPKSSISNAWFQLTIKAANNNSCDKYVYDAFISYCSSDYKWINNQLLPNLENDIDSMKLCIYDRDFLPGREISSCIMESINKSRKIILILTNQFVESQWCLWEMKMAQYALLEDKREDLLIVLLEDLEGCNIPPLLQYLLNTRIYLAWDDDNLQRTEFWKKLRAIINGSLNSF